MSLVLCRRLPPRLSPHDNLARLPEGSPGGRAWLPQHGMPADAENVPIPAGCSGAGRHVRPWQRGAHDDAMRPPGLTAHALARVEGMIEKLVRRRCRAGAGSDERGRLPGDEPGLW
jgi:hypothetical protein